MTEGSVHGHWKPSVPFLEKITSNSSTSYPSSYPTLRYAESVFRLANFPPMLTG